MKNFPRFNAPRHKLSIVIRVGFEFLSWVDFFISCTGGSWLKSIPRLLHHSILQCDLFIIKSSDLINIAEYPIEQSNPTKTKKMIRENSATKLIT